MDTGEENDEEDDSSIPEELIKVIKPHNIPKLISEGQRFSIIHICFLLGNNFSLIPGMTCFSTKCICPSIQTFSDGQ